MVIYDIRLHVLVYCPAIAHNLSAVTWKCCCRCSKKRLFTYCPSNVNQLSAASLKNCRQSGERDLIRPSEYGTRSVQFSESTSLLYGHAAFSFVFRHWKWYFYLDVLLEQNYHLCELFSFSFQTPLVLAAPLEWHPWDIIPEGVSAPFLTGIDVGVGVNCWCKRERMVVTNGWLFYSTVYFQFFSRLKHIDSSETDSWKYHDTV